MNEKKKIAAIFNERMTLIQSNPTVVVTGGQGRIKSQKQKKKGTLYPRKEKPGLRRKKARGLWNLGKKSGELAGRGGGRSESGTITFGRIRRKSPVQEEVIRCLYWVVKPENEKKKVHLNATQKGEIAYKKVTEGSKLQRKPPEYQHQQSRKADLGLRLGLDV